MEISSNIQGDTSGESCDKNDVGDAKTAPVNMEIEIGDVDKKKHQELVRVIENAVQLIGNRKARVTVHIDIDN